MLCAPVFIFTPGSSKATSHIQYTFLSLCQFVPEKTDKTREYSKSTIFVSYENGRQRLLGAQSINAKRASLKS